MRRSSYCLFGLAPTPCPEIWAGIRRAEVPPTDGTVRDRHLDDAVRFVALSGGRDQARSARVGNSDCGWPAVRASGDGVVEQAAAALGAAAPALVLGVSWLVAVVYPLDGSPRI
jgi:hypothetical protein